MKKSTPNIKVRDLSSEARGYIRSLIREFCLKHKIYKSANEEGIGLDETEECLEELLNRGEIKFFYDELNSIMILKKWNRETEEYE